MESALRPSSRMPFESCPANPLPRTKKCGSCCGAVARSNSLDSVTSRIDRIVLHRHLGFPIFFLVLISLFAAIFWAAQPFMDAIDSGFGAVGDLFKAMLLDSAIVRFLADGVIGGV